MSEVRDEHVALRVTSLERSESLLKVGYELRNVGTQPLWVFNQLYRTAPSGHFRLDPNKVYVELKGTDTLVLSKALRPVPKRLSVEFPEIPCVTRLEPKATLSEVLTLALPVEEQYPYRYGAAKAKAIPADTLAKVHLRLGYLADGPDLSFYRGKDTAEREYAFPRYSEANARQLVVDSGPLPFPPVAKKQP
ncbi:MAG: hypothetical protein JXB05_38115 [Myxococcaceae bacterium]|nr:hypothetical protein [Myxococcaceae bacterium]